MAYRLFDAELAKSGLVGRRRLRQRHQDDAVGAGLMDQQVAVAGRPHVPDDAAIDIAGRDRPTLERLGRGIEAHQRVRPHTGFVVPDRAARVGEPVGMRVRTARRRPFGDLAGLRVVASETALLRVDVPDHTVVGDVQASDGGLRDRQLDFGQLHRRRVDLEQAVAAVAGDPRHAVGVRS